MPDETQTDSDASSEHFELRDIDKAPDTVKDGVGLKKSDKTDPEDETSKAFNKDLWDRFRLVGDENVRLREEIIGLKEQVHTAATLDKLIHPYAAKAFMFMVCYASFVGVMVILDAERIGKFHIDPDILKILIGSTAANVIGLVGMVLTGVFVGARKRG